MDGVSESDRQLAASRYYVHTLRVYQYAMAVIRGVMTLEQAKATYDAAMRNYDGVIALAPTGHCEEANASDMAMGADAVEAAVAQAQRLA